MKTLLLAAILGAMALHAQVDPLEGLWLGAWLVHAAAERGCTGARGGARVADVARFHRAGTADHRRVRPADDDAADRNRPRTRPTCGAGNQ